MLKYVMILLLMIVATKVSAQKRDSTYVPKSEIKLSYLGSIVYPGLRGGAELPLRLKRIIISGKSKTLLKVRSLTLNLGYYHQKDFHDNFFFTAEWQLRKISQQGLFSEFSPGVGFSRTFLDGTTYKVSDNGAISIKKMAGYNYAMITLAYGIGYDFAARSALPLKVFTKFSLLWMFPYNSSLYFRPAFESGIIFTPKSFINTHPFIKTKYK